MGDTQRKRNLTQQRAIGISLFVVLLIFGMVPVRAVDDDHQVLYLSAYSYATDSVPVQLAAVREALGGESDVKYLFMDTRNQSDLAAAKELRNRLDEWRLLPTIDAVIVSGDAALKFVLRYREDYFAGLPIAFLDVRQPTTVDAAMERPGFFGAESAVPFRETIELAVQLYPNATQVVCIGDGTDAARGLMVYFYGQDRLFPQLEFHSLDLGEMTHEEIARQMAQYGQETILVYAQMSSDSSGNTYSDRQAGQMLSEMTSIPIFSPISSSLGTGLLGGCVDSQYEIARYVGEDVRAILDGTGAPEDMGLLETPQVYQFDTVVLDHYGISTRALPAGTQYLNDPLREVITQYKAVLVGGMLAIVLLTGLLAVALWENRKRQALICEVRERESQLKSMMDLVPGGICSFQVTGGGEIEEIRFNAGFYQLLGYPQTQGQSAEPLCDLQPDQQERFQALLRDCAVGNETHFQGTFQLRRCDGRYLWMSIQAALARAENGRRTYYGMFTDVDALKRMQEHLEKNERVLHAAMDHAEVDYWLYYPELHMADQSMRSQKTFGVQARMENYPQSWYEQGITFEEDVHLLKEAYAIMDGGGARTRCEMRERLSDGKWRWVEIKMTALYDETGRRTMVLCTSVTCTERHQAIERYERQKQSIRASLPEALTSAQLNLTKNTCENGPALYPELLEGVDGTADAVFRRMQDHAVTQEQGREFAAQFNRQTLLEAYERGTSLMSTERCCLLGGVRRWVTVRFDIARNPATGDVEARVYSFDIEDRKSIEQIMDAMIRREYLMILRIDAAANTARVFASRDGRELSHEITRAEEALLGTVEDSYAGEDLQGALSSLRMAEVRAQLKQKREYTVYVDCRNQKGEVRRLRYSFVWLDRDSETLCCTMTDTTDVFAKELRRSEALRAALEEAQRANQAKSEFLSRMSHEIRTPMNAILGLAQLAQQDAETPEAREMMEKLHSSGEYLLGLINDVLDMSRIESGHIELHPETVDAGGLLKTVQDLMMPRMKEKGVRFRMEVSGAEGLHLMTDRLRMQQIYINLLGNAVKFSEPGTCITCKVDYLPRSAEWVACVIVITDEGCGMSPKFLERAFEPFEQEENAYQNPQSGTGLGLAIVRNLVEQMGGTIRVESELGKGSRFTVEIVAPKGRPDAKTAETPHKTDLSCLRGKRILLAEDHPINTEIARKMLTQAGLLVEHAENGQTALERYLHTEAGHFDGVLMDIRMPRMNGIEAAKAIRASGRADAQSIPIIAMTANAFESDRQETRAAGMNAHLSKPVRQEELLDVLGKLIR